MSELSKLDKWLSGKKKILAVTHRRPDGDAIGSLYGFYHLMTRRGVVCHIHLEFEMPPVYKRIKELTTLPKRIFVGKEVDLTSYDGVVVLDSARATMPSYTGLVKTVQKRNIPSCNIDHHPDNELYAELNIILPDYCATAAILADFAAQLDYETTPEAATALMLGVIRDTGGFRFQNTSPKTFRISADLMEKGACFHDLNQHIFFSNPIHQLRFMSSLVLNHLNFSYSGRVLTLKISDDLFNEYGMTKKEMEGVIDTLRGVDGVIITCILTSNAEEVKLSMRSSSEKYPVDRIAHQLDGGGHKLASGARFRGGSLSAAESRFLSLLGEYFA